MAPDALNSPSGYLIRSSAGERFRYLAIDVHLPLGQNIRCRWPASGCPPRCYRVGSHDLPLRIFPQFNLHAHYKKFTRFLCWLVMRLIFSILLNNCVIADREHCGYSQCPWRTFRSDESSCHAANLRPLLASRHRHRPYAWGRVQ